MKTTLANLRARTHDCRAHLPAANIPGIYDGDEHRCPECSRISVLRVSENVDPFGGMVTSYAWVRTGRIATERELELQARLDRVQDLVRAWDDQLFILGDNLRKHDRNRLTVCRNELLDALREPGLRK